MLFLLRKASGNGPWAWVVIMVLGLAVMIWGLGAVWEAFSSLTWDEAPGVVSRSYVASSAVEREGSRLLRRNVPFVYVDYRVDGKRYTTRRLQIGDPGMGLHVLAEGLIEDYPKGEQVQVSYDPDDPSRAVIEAGPRLGNLWRFLFGLALYVGGKIGRRVLA